MKLIPTLAFAGATAFFPMQALALSGGSIIAPTGSNDPGWANVGQVNANGYSCVYLGDYASGFWVISAAHVISSDGSGSVTLNGSSYSIIAGSGVHLANTGNSTYPTADLYMFRVAGDSALASLSNLTLATTTPSLGTSLTAIGWGGGSESYGTVSLVARNITPGTVTVTGSNGNSTLLEGSSSTVQFIEGDSGGAMFYKVGGNWVLAGINEATGTDGNGNYIAVGSQISSYYTQINGYLTAIPEPSTYGLMAGGLALGVAVMRRRRSRGR